MLAPRQLRRRNRGLALVTVLMLMVLFFILIGLMMDNLTNELIITGNHGRSNSALRAAYLGVEEMQYQFELNDAGAAPGQTPPPQFNTYTDQDGTQVRYDVNVDAITWAVNPPFYLIHAKGTSGTSVRNIDALLQKKPYSAYSLFTISEKNNYGGIVYYASGEQFNGPVYSGGPMHIWYQDGAANPIFGSTVTTAQTPVWVPGAPSSGADWAAVITDKTNFSQVSSPLTLPAAVDNSAVQNAAYTGNAQPAATPAFPGAPGLYINQLPVTTGQSGVPLTTGLYIVGSPLVSSSVVGNVETLQFVIGATVYNVIIDFGLNTTKVTDAGGGHIADYTGVPSGQGPFGSTGPNGAIWATDSITLSANNVFHGKFTFASPDASGLGNPPMYVLGSQTYFDASNDELAYWANDIILQDLSNGNIEIDGLMLTGYYGECSVICNDGTFKNIYCSAAPLCTGGTGVLTINGSLIENVRGKRGTLGNISGFSTNVVYDPRLGRKPPPFTPSTTQYDVIALCTADNGTTCGQ